MSALFISHSSADNAIALELRTRLAEKGHRSVFLDFDPEHGIPAGRHWEQELYTQLRGCQAMIVLCSAKAMASAWCFAEITHARALGKPVFPLKVDDCQVSSLLGDVQITDLTRDPTQGYQRLFAGLAAAGLDPAGLFDWDGSRPPYPGLRAFQKADAAVYFGRDAAIQSTIETLNRLQRLGGARLVLVLGASGSGKSSLMRAGVVPRLERDRDRWLAVEPFRPLTRPFDAMAMALAGLAQAGEWRAIRDSLEGAASGASWRDLINDIRRGAGRAEASVLLVVDQFEELLGHAADSDAAFLRLLRMMTGTPDSPLFVVATLRSDFLAAFQTHPALQDVPYEPIHLSQIALADLAQVIEGPAKVAGIELEPGLAHAMVADTATDDALPLLAFTLRELWDRFGAGGQLRLEQYRGQLGGLQGALARAAEAICSERSLSAAEMELLRKALLRLVRVDAEGRFVRQPRPWSELPPSVHPLLERFVQARLLVSRGEGNESVLEVAHEALFRSWDRLAAWINADREFLLWCERLRGDCAEWQRNAHDASLTLRGPLLAEAQRWLAEREDDLDAGAREFITASIAARDREQAARDRRRRRLILSLAAAGAFFFLLSGVAAWEWWQADQQRRLALARQLNVQADVAQRRDAVHSLLLTVQSLRSAWTAEGHHALIERLDLLARPQASPWRPHPGPIRAMALSPDRRWLATAGPRGLHVQAADGAGHDLKSQNGHDYIHALAFSPDGQWFAASCRAEVICIYDTASWQVAKQLPIIGGVINSLSFSRDSKVLASSTRQAPTVRFHAVPGWAEQPPITISPFAVEAMTFSPDGQRIAVSAREGVELWQFDTDPRTKIATTPGAGGKSIRFSPDGRMLAAAGSEYLKLLEIVVDGGGVRLAEKWPQLVQGSQFGHVGFSDDGRYVAISDDRVGVRVADIELGRAVALAPQPAGAQTFTRGRRVLAGHMDGRIVEWDPDDKARQRIAHAGAVHAVALSADSRWLATASAGDLLRVFDTGTGKELRALQLASDARGLAFSPDGRWLSSVNGKNLWLVDTSNWRVVGPFVHEDRIIGIAFGADGKMVATTTVWDANLPSRWGLIKRHTRIRVWDTAAVTDLAWMFDLEGDRRRATGSVLQPSREVVTVTSGGDAALAARAGSWPAVLSAAPSSDLPELLVPSHSWLTAQTAQGTVLADATLQRARSAQGVAENQGLFAFSADGKLLASAHEREARLWPLMTDDLVADACVRLHRNLSCHEWREALGDLPYARTCAQQPDPPDFDSCKSGSGLRLPTLGRAEKGGP